jgi:hypothetical protein
VIGPLVREGMLLVVRDERASRVRYDLWAVKRVGRPRKNGSVGVTLISAAKTLQAEATATFPDGAVRDPWRVVWFSESDRALMWRRSEAPHLHAGDEAAAVVP